MFLPITHATAVGQADVSVGQAAGGPADGGDSPPEFLQRYLEERFGSIPTEYRLADFAGGDLDGDQTDELIALYHLAFDVPPSKKNRGEAERRQQTVLVVFAAGADGMTFRDDIHLPWCEGSSCRGIAVTPTGQIEVERTIESGAGSVETSVLTLKYDDQDFAVAQPPRTVER